MDAGPPLHWIALRAEVPSEREDDVVAWLGEESLGVEVVRDQGESAVIRIYFAANSDPSSMLEKATRLLATRGLDPEGCHLRIETVEDGRWVERYQASLRPLPLGDRFLVVPGSSAPEATSRDPIFLVPGRAFGTGEHPTTRLCAHAIERSVLAETHWLDLGTGTGILAVIAARCGASRVDALDTDPEAVAVAGEVVGANAAGGRVRVALGSVDRVRPGTLDGIVANIAVEFFLQNAPAVASALKPRGLLLCSGFLTGEEAEVGRALEQAGLLEIDIAREDGWTLLRARKEAAR